MGISIQAPSKIKNQLLLDGATKKQKSKRTKKQNNLTKQPKFITLQANNKDKMTTNNPTIRNKYPTNYKIIKKPTRKHKCSPTKTKFNHNTLISTSKLPITLGDLGCNSPKENHATLIYPQVLYIYIQKYKQQTPNKSKFPLNKTLTKAQKKRGKPKTSKKNYAT